MKNNARYRHYSYVIYSEKYNKDTNSITEYYGSTEIYCGSSLVEQQLKKRGNIEFDEYVKKRLSILISQYDNHYFTEADRTRYNRKIQLIDNKIKKAREYLTPKFFQQEQIKLENSKLNYRFITKKSNKFLYDLVRKYHGDITIKKLDIVGVNGIFKIDKFRKYINENADKILFYRDMYNSEDEKKQYHIEQTKKWCENNKQQRKEYVQDYQKENREKINKYQNNYKKENNYFKKLKNVFTKQQIEEYEKSILNIIENNDKKISVQKLTDMIIENKSIQIIIKKIVNDKLIRSSISSRLSYLKIKK